MIHSLNCWQGDKVRLRAMEPSDISLFESFDDEMLVNMEKLNFPRSKERVRKWFEKEMQARMNDEFRFMAEDHDGNVIGTIETFQCHRRFRHFKYGLLVAKPYRGQGYASEMILLLLKYYFMELGYEKVTPHVYAFNEPSIALHDKLGFTREGRLRNMIYTNGQYHDEIYFGMTKDEFLQLYCNFVE